MTTSVASQAGSSKTVDTLRDTEVMAAENTLLQEALRGTAAARTPQAAAEAVLAACMHALGAPSGRIFLLDLSTGTYVPFVESRAARAAGVHHPRVLNPLRTLTRSIAPASDFFRTGERPDQKGVVIYALRGQSCVGVIHLEGLAPEDLDDAVRQDLTASANLLVSVYENEFAFRLLDNLQHPLDFTQSDNAYFRDIAALIALASSMEFVALREADDGRLLALTVDGFRRTGDDVSDWDLDPVDDYPHFARALGGETVPVPNMRDPHLAALRTHDWAKDLRSFVAVPIRVGKDVFGVMSVAARCEFEYAPVELRGFESIANAVGVSIANFRSARIAAAQVGSFKEAAVAITAIEVARAARHEAAGYIDSIGLGVRAVQRKITRTSPAIDADFAKIEKDFRALEESLDKIRVAMKPPDEKRELVDLLQLCEEARLAVVGRLQEERIAAHCTGARVKVWALPDWLRQVFLNLFLNSIDAFRSAKRQGRRIDIVIERPAARSNEIDITYTDNAGGINPQQLHVPAEYAEMPFQQQIFSPGVTSKAGGSGFGLWLVRRILAQHAGSIDLVDHRQGVTFRIRLPRPDAVGHGQRA